MLLTHPDIADTAVIGVYVEDLATELPRAYVVRKGQAHSDSGAFEKDIQAWIAERVAPHKRLRGGVVVIDAIPKSCVPLVLGPMYGPSLMYSPTGKILRKNLRKMVEDEKEKASKVKAKL